MGNLGLDPCGLHFSKSKKEVTCRLMFWCILSLCYFKLTLTWRDSSIDTCSYSSAYCGATSSCHHDGCSNILRLSSHVCPVSTCYRILLLSPTNSNSNNNNNSKRTSEKMKESYPLSHQYFPSKYIYFLFLCNPFTWIHLEICINLFFRYYYIITTHWYIYLHE